MKTTLSEPAVDANTQQPVRFTLSTGGHAGQQAAGVAVIDVVGDEAELVRTVGVLVGELPAVGAIKLREIAGVDHGLVVRVGVSHIQLMPHGGQAVVEGVVKALTRVGGVQALAGERDFLPPPSGEGWGGGAGQQSADPRALFPEAPDLPTACALHTLTHAASPRAIDVVAEHAARWADADGLDCVSDAHHGALNHLLSPPLVVVIGVSNIGKSTLLNALAGRTAALAHDMPGTTRDHVGVSLILDGLALQWVDTPGVRAVGDTQGPDAIEHEALVRAQQLAQRADLVVHCVDAAEPSDAALEAFGLDGKGPASSPKPSAGGGVSEAGVPVLTCALRCDRATAGQLEAMPACAVRTAAAAPDAQASSIPALSQAVRRVLVPDAALTDERLWAFHSALRSLR